MKTKLVPAILVAFSAIVSAPAGAVVIYTTLGGGNTFQGPHHVSLDENTGQVPGSPVDLNWAMAWTPSVDAIVTDIDVALSLGDAFTLVDENVAQMFLHLDVGGLPGAVIDTYQFTNLTSETAGGAVESAASSLNPLVMAGTTYWISLSAGLPGNGLYSQVGWHLNDQGVSGARAREDNNLGWVSSGSPTQSAFRISGGPTVPEPTTLALLGAGLFGLAALRRRAA